jgi:glycosyltransferase involved in cell wall biosynthesis
MILLSVIISAHNSREIFLTRVLEALKRQTISIDCWELIIIDNASNEDISKKYDISWNPCSMHVHESKLGLTHARLRGIRESKGGIVVFVDDDTVLANDYLEKTLLIGREWPFIGAWGGRIIPEYEVPLPDWVGSEVWRLTICDIKNDIWSNLREGFETKPAGAGMCVRRSVAERYVAHCQNQENISSLDRSGVELMGYGDMDIVQCALDLGLGTGKSTKLSLTHLISSSRLTLDYFVRHAEGDAKSLTLFRAMHGLEIECPSKPNFIKWLSLQFFYWRKKIPKERKLIHQAHIRGLVTGFQLAQEYLKNRLLKNNNILVL